MARFTRFLQTQSKLKPSKPSFFSRHGDKLMIAGQIGGGLAGTYATLKGANMMYDEFDELSENIGDSMPLILIGGAGLMMMIMMM